jgi:hypothetical protein
LDFPIPGPVSLYWVYAKFDSDVTIVSFVLRPPLCQAVVRHPPPAWLLAGMSGGPRRAEDTELGHDGRDVVGRPFLADLAVGDPVDVHGVPPDRLAVARHAQQAALDRGGHDEPDHDQVVLGGNVLLGRVQVRQRSDERPQQAG